METIKENVIETINPGERAANRNPGGGGYGDPYEREIDAVVWDVRNGLVSIEGARQDYGVIFSDPTKLVVDRDATSAMRGAAVAAD